MKIHLIYIIIISAFISSCDLTTSVDDSADKNKIINVVSQKNDTIKLPPDKTGVANTIELSEKHLEKLIISEGYILPQTVFELYWKEVDITKFKIRLDTVSHKISMEMQIQNKRFESGVYLPEQVKSVHVNFKEFAFLKDYSVKLDGHLDSNYWSSLMVRNNKPGEGEMEYTGKTSTLIFSLYSLLRSDYINRINCQLRCAVPIRDRTQNGKPSFLEFKAILSFIWIDEAQEK